MSLFSRFLNPVQLISWSHRLTGKLFQIGGPAAAKDLSSIPLSQFYCTLKTHLSINLSITVVRFANGLRGLLELTWLHARRTIHSVGRWSDRWREVMYVWCCMSSCRRRRPVPSSINAEMMKSGSGHDYGIDEQLELRTAPVVDGSDYVTRVLCTGCGRDFDVLRSDNAGYAPVLSAHAHGTPDVGARSFPGCRSLSVVPLESEPPRRGGGSAAKSARKYSFQTAAGWGVNTECGGTCSCPGTSSTSDACVDSTSATCGRSRRDTARACELWRSVDDTHMSLSWRHDICMTSWHHHVSVMTLWYVSVTLSLSWRHDICHCYKMNQVNTIRTPRSSDLLISGPIFLKTLLPVEPTTREHRGKIRISGIRR